MEWGTCMPASIKTQIVLTAAAYNDATGDLLGGIGLWIGGGGCTRTELDDGGGVPTGDTFPRLPALTVIYLPPHCQTSFC